MISGSGLAPFPQQPDTRAITQMRVPSIVTPRSVTVFVNGKTYVANSDHPNFEAVRAALKAENHDPQAIIDLIDIKRAVEAQSGGLVQIKGNTVYYGGKAVHSTLTTRMVDMLSEGFSVDPLIKFMEKLYQNPSKTAVDGLYDFLEAARIPITPDGNFLAYKKVRSDYYDIHSGTMFNGVGTVMKMHRFEVVEDPNVTCAAGLHVCSESYLPHFGDTHNSRVVVCEVEPQNVVAVPKDYANAKMRVCEYKVVGEVTQDKTKTYFSAPVMTGTEPVDAEFAEVDGDPSYLEFDGDQSDDQQFEKLKQAYDQGYDQGYADGFDDGRESAR